MFRENIVVKGEKYSFFNILALEKSHGFHIRRLPFSIRILVENLLRHLDGDTVKKEDLAAVADWQKKYDTKVEIPFHPARVLMQDFTGVPAVVDLAAMRDAVAAAGGDPATVNPRIPVDLIVDHSVQLDAYGTKDALKKNVSMEYERNKERYRLLKWAQMSFANFRVVPPGTGICHQVNLEYLGQGAVIENTEQGTCLYPDSLVGTDSHTTMINGIGIMGWGVGGIEAEAVMLGRPYFMAIPEVVGVRLTGRLQPGVTATDLVLTVTRLLRKTGVVEKFVEFFGPGLGHLTIPDRATIANMSPEYGATMGFFPTDHRTIDYLNLTGRKDQAEITSAWARACGLYADDDEPVEYSHVVDLDLSTIVSCMAGPARPQDRIPLTDMKSCFKELLECRHKRNADIETISQFVDESGCVTNREDPCDASEKKAVMIKVRGEQVRIGNGSVVIAAITSCTNTSNPFGLMGAGLLARNAVQKGILSKPHVKTSFAPGSKVVVNYLKDAGLMPYLEALGFHVAGFGCTTCIGNSGPLHPDIEAAIQENDFTVAAVLSGNRNFEARIHQRVKGNFLASPMLVAAFAIAGKIDMDLSREPLAVDPNGDPVYLKEIWPDNKEIETCVDRHVKTAYFIKEYEQIFDGDDLWQSLDVKGSLTFDWDPSSTYIRKPPFFKDFSIKPPRPGDIQNARPLLLMNNSVTTDHISPAGAIPEDYPAGRYLLEKGVVPEDFNSYGARRGNHEVMMRGTFGNIRIKNEMLDHTEGSYTRKFPEGNKMFIYDAAMAYAKEAIPLIVLAGTEYGTGSSRDWAAKGSLLLGICAVIAGSYERIHRSNLVGMGILPLTFSGKDSQQSLGLDGSEIFSITGITDISPQKQVEIKAEKPDGTVIKFKAAVQLNTNIDIQYFNHGGILPYVLRQLI